MPTRSGQLSTTLTTREPRGGSCPGRRGCRRGEQPAAILARACPGGELLSRSTARACEVAIWATVVVPGLPGGQGHGCLPRGLDRGRGKLAVGVGRLQGTVAHHPGCPFLTKGCQGLLPLKRDRGSWRLVCAGNLGSQAEVSWDSGPSSPLNVREPARLSGALGLAPRPQPRQASCPAELGSGRNTAERGCARSMLIPGLLAVLQNVSTYHLYCYLPKSIDFLRHTPFPSCFTSLIWDAARN